MLTDVRFRGELARVVGAESLRLDVRTPLDVIRALAAMRPLALEVIREHDWRVKVDGLVLGDDESLDVPSRGRTIEFLPVPQGAGDAGSTIGKIFAGLFLALIPFAPFAPGFLAAETLGRTVALGLGSSLALGGLAQAIAPAASADPNAGEDRPASSAFNGAFQLTEEGHPVPLILGEHLAGSVVVSASATAEQQGDVPEGTAIITTNAEEGLASISVAQVIDLLGEGEIDGLLGGKTGIYFDGVALGDTDEVRYELRRGLPHGDPEQAPSEIVRGSEELFSVPTPNVTFGNPVTATLAGTDGDKARVTILVPSLYRINDKGERRDSSFRFQVEVSPQGLNQWQTVTFSERLAAQFSSDTTVVSTQRFSAYYDIDIPLRSWEWPRWRDSRFRFEYRVSGSADPWTVDPQWQPPNQIGERAGAPNVGRLVQLRLHSNEFRTATAAIYEVRLAWERELRGGGLETVYLTPTVINAYEKVEFVEVRGRIVNFSNPYQLDWDVPLTPGYSAWDIRVTRLTADPNETDEFNAFRWPTITRVTNDRLTFGDTAYVALRFDSRNRQGRIPSRQYRVRGLKCRIPTGYDPQQHTYAESTGGTWDGTFQATRQWTNNCAWLLLEILTNKRFGLGLDLDTQIDKWSLYECARYTDDKGFVGDRQYGWIPTDEIGGEGPRGFAPRFTFNLPVYKQEDAQRSISAILSAMRAQPWQGPEGRIYFSQDRPTPTTRLLSQANLVGKPQYVGPSLESSHSVVKVDYRDAEDLYRKKPMVVESLTLLQTFGYQRKELDAIGATNRWEAWRRGAWELDLIEHAPETATVRVGLGDVASRPGEVIALRDSNHNVGLRFGGRVAAATTTQITVDDTIEIEAGKTYSIDLQTSADTIVSRGITNTPGSYTVLTLDSALQAAEVPKVSAAFGITSNTDEARLFRVIGVTDAGSGEYELALSEYDPDRYDRVELGIPGRLPDENDKNSAEIAAPTNLAVAPFMYRRDDDELQAGVLLSWDRPTDIRVVLHEVRYRDVTGDGTWIDAGFTQGPSLEIRELENGTEYAFQVRARGPLVDDLSEWTLLQKRIAPFDVPPGDVQNFSATAVGSDLVVIFERVDDIHVTGYELRATTDSTPDWGTSALVNWINQTSIEAELAASTRYVVTIPAALDGTYLVKAKTENEDPLVAESVNAASATVTGLAPSDWYAWGTTTISGAWDVTHQNTEIVSNRLRLVPGQTFGIATYNQTIYIPNATLAAHVPDVAGLGVTSSYTMDKWPVLSKLGILSQAQPNGYDIQIEYRSSGDGTNYSPWRILGFDPPGTSLMGQYWQYRIVLESRDGGATTPEISLWRMLQYLPQRTEHGSGNTSTGNPQTVTFSKPFSVVPEITYSIIGSVTFRDYANITAITTTSFQIQTTNNNSPAPMPFSWIANGYGG